MAYVVAATQGGATSNGMALRVMVLTGAAASQTATGVSVNTSQQISVTTTVTGSRVYGAALGPNGTYPADSTTTQIDNITDATNSQQYLTFKALSLTGTPGAATYGYTHNNVGGCAAFEVLANGTLTEDGSAPAVASTLTATTVSSASFTPPGGSLLVALISSDGGSGVTTMTVATTGLTWTQKAVANTTSVSYAGVWIAQVPAAAVLFPNPLFVRQAIRRASTR